MCVQLSAGLAVREQNVTQKTPLLKTISLNDSLGCPKLLITID